jgi:outer membrane lipoprotein SlyB
LNLTRCYKLRTKFCTNGYASDTLRALNRLVNLPVYSRSTAMNATLGTFNAPSSAAFSTAPASSSKTLWAAVGVLGVCVVAMGGALVHISAAKPQDAYFAPTSGQVQGLSSSLVPLTAPAALPAAAAEPDKAVLDKKPANVTVKSTPATTKSGATENKEAGTVEKPRAPVMVASNTPAPVAEPAAARAPVQAQPAPMPTPAPTPVVVAQPAAKPICATCGVVESVTPITRKGEPGAVGAIAGGVLGAVLGNQVGQGSGKTVATVLGGVGGVLAGREIEKNVKKTTVYNVQVRMEDGSLRSFEQASSMAVGAKVTVEAGSLRAG